MNTIQLVLLVIIGGAWAQTEQSFSNALESLSPELRGKVNETMLQGFANQTIPLFKEKCEKNGGPDVFSKVQETLKTLPDCLMKSLNLTNVGVLQKEIDEAKPHGDLEEVFKKYCAKTPTAKECLKSALDVAQPCFTDKEKVNLKTIYNVTEQLAEFICFKDGDRIALFIAEGGPECYNEHTDAVQDCLNSTFGANYNISTDNITTDTIPMKIPEIKFEEKECKQLSQLQTCVVKALEACKTPTSANIIEALFKFVRKATPCGEATMVTQTAARSDDNVKGSAPGMDVTSLILVAALAFPVLL